MSSLAISLIVFAVVVGGALLGMALRAVLPEHHLGQDSKDIVKLGMGLIATIAAMALGILVASAKNSFDTQRNGLAQLAGNIILMDRALAHYGPDAKDAREMLRNSVADLLAQTWPQESAATSNDSDPQRREGSKAKEPSTVKNGGTEGKYEVVYDKIQALTPKTDAQRAFQAQALKNAMDIAQSRWLLLAQRGNTVPVPFLVVLVFWLAILFASFTLLAKPSTTAMVVLCLCAASVAGAIFLILELDRPYDGLIQLSSRPIRVALTLLGR